MSDIPRPGALCWSYLGLVPYGRALGLQRAVRQAVLEERVGDTLLLLQHPPVITLGRSARRGNVLASADTLAARGVELFEVERGGDVTLHAPGQLVGYPIRGVGRAVKSHVTGMTRAMQAALAAHGVDSWWRDDMPGVWTADGKIAAVGVDARGGVAMHGFALNLDLDLSLYDLIVPCGHRAPVTSLARLLGEGRAAPRVEELAPSLAGLLAAEYGVEAVAVPTESIVDSR